MAYINVAEWTPDHVAEWLRGLDDAVLPYVHFFLNNNIDGCRLLLLSSDDLTSLNVTKIGHQELILEGIDLLRQLHYNLTSETLQTLALRLGCKARSLFNDLKRNGPQEGVENAKQEKVSVATLSAVNDTLASVKSFISWLDRYPFEGQDQYIPVRKTILKLSIELASTAQRDQFVEKPHEVIKNSCLNLAELCDRIVQEINDPLIIQPALLDVSTIKKKPDEELGMHIHSSYSGVHMIGGVKFQSPAHRCGKIKEGDEIIQVNYQTVVGWQLKKLVHAMRDHPTEIHLTLKKRPRHTNILGQVIILRPYRIPSKKTAYGKIHKWSEGNSSLHIQEMYPTPPAEPPSPRDDVDDDDDSTFLPDDAAPPGEPNVANAAIQYVFLAKSRATVQRRATVSGASPTVTRPPVRIEDLVAGTSSLFTKEPVFRSVSHDPSKHLPSSGPELKLPAPSLVITKPEKKASKDGPTPKQQPKEETSTKPAVNCKPRPGVNTHLATDGNNLLSPPGKDTLRVPEISLQPQEEQYTILENKSLLENKGGDLDSRVELSSSSNEPKAGDEMENGDRKSHQLSGTSDNNENANTKTEGTIDVKVDNKSSAVSASQRKEIEPTSVTNTTIKSHERAEQLVQDTEPHGVISYKITIVGGVPHKSPNPSHGSKSPIQSPFLRHKANIAAKFGTRRISCKDLGMGDCEGWLYQRKDHKGFLPGLRWAKRWIVLKDNYLYCYRNAEDEKAECLIYLPGFTVSPSPECKSRKYAFKIHHSGTTFYFATESQQAMTKWMNKMLLAAIAYTSHGSNQGKESSNVNSLTSVENAYFSETDEESEECSTSSTSGVTTPAPSSDTGPTEKQDGLKDAIPQRKDPVLHFVKPPKPEIAPKPAKKEPGIAPVKHENKIFPKPKALPPNPNLSGHSRKLSEPILETKKLAKKLYRTDRAFSTGDASVEVAKLEGNKNKPVSIPSFRMAYIRSLSCVDSTHTTPSSSPKLVPMSETHMLSPLQECNEFTEKMYEGGGESSEKLTFSRNPRHSGPWSIHKDAATVSTPPRDVYSTTSLDRQKFVGKDVQNRVGGSTNGNGLRQKVCLSNSAGLKDRKREPEVKDRSPRKDAGPVFYDTEIQQCHAHTDSSASESSSPAVVKCSRRKGSRDSIASSSSTSKNFFFGADLIKGMRKTSTNPVPVPDYSHVHTHQQVETLDTAKDSDSSDSQSHQTMLDREYNRLYGRKKPDTISLEQVRPVTSVLGNDPAHSKCSGGKSSTNRSANKLPKSATSQEIHSLYCCQRKSWGSSEDYFKKAVRRSSSSEASVTSGSGGGRYNPRPHPPCMESITEQARLKYGSLPEESIVARNMAATNREASQTSQPNLTSSASHEIKSLSLDRFQHSNDKENMRRLDAIEIPLEDNGHRTLEPASKRNSNGTGKAPLPSPKSTSNAFKLFSSPKFVKKLGSPRLDKKHLVVSPKKSPKTETTSEHANRWPFPEKILGSPRLARAIFGSKPEPRHVATTSSAVQTDSLFGTLEREKPQISTPEPITPPLPIKVTSTVESPLPASDVEKNPTVVCKDASDERTKSSSNSSLNSTASGSAISTSSSSHFYVETRIRPQIMISLPLVTESSSDDRSKSPETPRTPIKPTMGVAMLGKKRTSTIGGSETAQLCGLTTKTEITRMSPVPQQSERSEVMMNINCEPEEDELIQMLSILRKADVSLDGVNLNERRRKTMMSPCEDKRISQLALSIRALKRTLKDKEMELDALEQLLMEPITSERLEQWALKHPDLLPSEYC